MKTTRIIRAATALLLVVLIALCAASCGESVTIKITDRDKTTEVTAVTGSTVGDALKQAGITLSNKLKSIPPADVKITETTDTIILQHYSKVTVSKNSRKIKLGIFGGTVEDALVKANMTVEGEEQCNHELDEFLEDGMKIHVWKDVKVKLVVYGKKKNLTTTAETVAALLAEQDIEIGKNDYVDQSPETVLENKMTINVKHIEYKEETRKEKIPFTIKERTSDLLNEGSVRISQEGKDGLKRVKYKVQYVNGKETSKQVLSEKILKRAQAKVIVLGTKKVTPTAPRATTPRVTAPVITPTNPPATDPPTTPQEEEDEEPDIIIE